MSTPKRLMKYLVEELNFPLNSICELHKPCATIPRCSQHGIRRFVNFDEVKTRYQGNLMALAQTSSSLEHLCNEYMLEKIDSIQGIETYYKQCRELDDFIQHHFVVANNNLR